MAVKASASITLYYVIDIQATYRYYLLQSSAAAVPTKPTTHPPAAAWDDTEPSYKEGSTDSLYVVDCTKFTDGSFSYTPVSLSTSYEAAKAAYNKAVAATNTANKKAQVYYQASAPSGTAHNVNDIWFDTDGGNQMYYWDGSAWKPKQFGSVAIADGAITAEKIYSKSITSEKIDVPNLFAQDIVATGSITGLKYLSSGKDSYNYPSSMTLDGGCLNMTSVDGNVTFNTLVSGHDVVLEYLATANNVTARNFIMMNGNGIEHFVSTDSLNYTTIFKTSEDGVKVSSLEVAGTIKEGGTLLSAKYSAAGHTHSEYAPASHSHSYLPLSGGTLTGKLAVGSASLETNGYVTGTWLKTTANIALGSAATAFAVVSSGWIYTRTAAQVLSDIGAAPVDHAHNYLPLSGGTLTGELLISTGTTQSATKGIKWAAINSKNPYIGYATDQTDGTFVVGSLLGKNYASGLAIGGGSGNLLWKGSKVAVTSDISLSTLGITATAVELNYCDGVTSNIQTQLNGKAASGHTHSNYALDTHTHSNYALPTHTHSNYALATHTHSNYATSSHKHNSIWNTAGTYAVYVSSTGNFLRNTDSNQCLGSETTRWKTAYLTSAASVSSDRRLKEDFSTDMDKYIALIDRVLPTSFYRTDEDVATRKRHTGYIAQDFEKALVEVGMSERDFNVLDKYVDEFGNVSYGLCQEELISIIHAKVNKESAYARYRLDQLEMLYRQQSIELQEAFLEIASLKKQVKSLTAA